MAVATKAVQQTKDSQGLAVRVIQPDASVVSAVCILRADVGDGLCEIDRLALPAPATSGRSGNRLVAIANIPGVTQWEVEVTGADNPGVQLQYGNYFVVTQPVTWIFTGGGSPLAGQQPASYVWVNAETGNDGTAQRGRIDFPAQTLLRALQLAQPADCLLVSPGNYPSTLFDAATLAKNNLTIQGDGAGANDTNSVNVGAFQITAGSPAGAAAVSALTLRNLRLSGGLGTGLQVVNGQGDGNTFLSQGLVCEGCRFQGDAAGIEATQVGNLILRDCESSNVVRLFEVGGGRIQDCELDMVRVTYDVTQQTPSTGRNALVIASSNLGDLVVSEQAVVLLDEASEAQTIDGTALDAGPGAEQPGVQAHGRCGAVSVNCPEWVTVPGRFDFDGAQLASLQTASLDPGNGNAHPVSARGCTFDGPIQAGHRVALNLKASAFDQAFLSAAGSVPGVIERDNHVITGVPNAIVASPVAINPAFPDANYVVTRESDNAAATESAITGKTGASFDHVEGAAVGTFNFLLTRRG